MGQIKVQKTHVKRKDGKPQPKLYARRVTINNSVSRLSAAAKIKSQR